MITEIQPIYERREKEGSNLCVGKTEYNFSLRDAKGNMISLHDFNNRFVVLNLWAMWCAPCLHEKPFFQKSRELYKHDGKIVFVSLSVDGLGKIDVWKKFLENHSWNGIELISDPWGGVMEYYKIRRIPRILLFGKNGKIINMDMPRPSSPEFKFLIDQSLQSNN